MLKSVTLCYAYSSVKTVCLMGSREMSPYPKKNNIYIHKLKPIEQMGEGRDEPPSRDESNDQSKSQRD